MVSKSANFLGNPNFKKQMMEFTEYACPRCKLSLIIRKGYLSCELCRRNYPVRGEIPDFISEDLTKSEHPVLGSVSKLDKLARIYETRLWYPIVYHLYGGLSIPSVDEEVRMVTEMVDAEGGVVLDVGCGTGLFTRSVARKAKEVYGIDISRGMLEQAMRYAKKEGLGNINFARANVEGLPFPDAFFDGALCCGALHLFPDTVVALKEMNRVMRHGSKLAVMTFVKSRLFRIKWIQEHLRKEHGVRVFDVDDLDFCLGQANFGNFNYNIYGSMILFEAEKEIKS